jgi:hypothetical protein
MGMGIVYSVLATGKIHTLSLGLGLGLGLKKKGEKEKGASADPFIFKWKRRTPSYCILPQFTDPFCSCFAFFSVIKISS